MFLQLYTYLSSTFNTVSRVKRAGVVIFYWLIDMALTNQHFCILREAINRHLFLKKLSGNVNITNIILLCASKFY